MYRTTLLAVTTALFLVARSANADPVATTTTVATDNPSISMSGYLAVADAAAAHRAQRRLTEAQFMEMAKRPGTVVLDARSRERYEQLHIAGAINLPFPDITVESLARLLPDPNTTVLIYCNNNFSDALEPFPRKKATAALNLSTYLTLYDYGYRNVYELGPLLEVSDTSLDFEGSLTDTIH